MSASAFIGPFSKRARSRKVATHSSDGTSRQSIDATQLFARHRTSDWLGDIGQHLRLRVSVEDLRTTGGDSIVLVARVEDSVDLVEWTMPRRHRITIGDRLALSGLVKAHTTRHDTRVTVLRDCFNPLRMT